MKNEVKIRVDEVCDKPYDEVVKLVEKRSINDIFTDVDGYEYQLEINISWDDKSKGVIRVAAFVDGGPKQHWWSSFFSKSYYERFVYPRGEE